MRCRARETFGVAVRDLYVLYNSSCVIIVCVLVLGCLVSSGCMGLCDYLCDMG